MSAVSDLPLFFFSIFVFVGALLLSPFRFCPSCEVFSIIDTRFYSSIQVGAAHSKATSPPSTASLMPKSAKRSKVVSYLMPNSQVFLCL